MKMKEGLPEPGCHAGMGPGFRALRRTNLARAETGKEQSQIWTVKSSGAISGDAEHASDHTIPSSETSNITFDGIHIQERASWQNPAPRRPISRTDLKSITASKSVP